MSDFLVKRGDLRECRIAESEPPAVDAGQALLRVDSFGLSANNVTYAVMGEAMSYWDFFPAKEGERLSRRARETRNPPARPRHLALTNPAALFTPTASAPVRFMRPRAA